MCVQGKGGRDRCVPLAGDSLARLRRCWQTCRPRQWLFGPRAGQPGALHVQLAQRWYGRARDAAGITKVGGIHSLRHGDATHLLKAGVDLYSLQQWLGHNHSRAARIAGSGAGAWSSPAALIARPLQRPGWPSVEVRRDAHARPHSVRTVGLRTQALALPASATPRQYAAPVRRATTPGRAATLPHRPHASFGVSLQPRRHCAARCSRHQHCRHRPLKLATPTSPPPRRFCPTRFIRQHARPCLRSASSRRQINAIR